MRHLDIKNKRDIIDYLGLENKEDFNLLKENIKKIIEFCNEYNYEDYCLFQDYASGYFDEFQMIKRIDDLCVIKYSYCI